VGIKAHSAEGDIQQFPDIGFIVYDQYTLACHGLKGPLVHGDAKTAFAAVSWVVAEICVVDFTQFLAQVQAHAAAFGNGGKKWLK
jgi:hypothetical protein